MSFEKAVLMKWLHKSQIIEFEKWMGGKSQNIPKFLDLVFKQEHKLK